jgi:hypothetical protein
MNVDLANATFPSQGEGEAAQAASPALGIYATWAPKYRAAGFWPLPIEPGEKACYMKGWPKGMTAGEFEVSLNRYATHGIGLRMGSPFPDGTALAALDIDDDAYVEVAKALLGNPLCMRRGGKGVCCFVRLRGPAKYVSFNVPGKKKHSEFLAGGGHLCVIPPTVHPKTEKPYHWLKKTLLEVSYLDLPLVEVN